MESSLYGRGWRIRKITELCKKLERSVPADMSESELKALDGVRKGHREELKLLCETEDMHVAAYRNKREGILQRTAQEDEDRVNTSKKYRKGMRKAAENKAAIAEAADIKAMKTRLAWQASVDKARLTQHKALQDTLKKAAKRELRRHVADDTFATLSEQKNQQMQQHRENQKLRQETCLRTMEAIQQQQHDDKRNTVRSRKADQSHRLRQLRESLLPFENNVQPKKKRAAVVPDLAQKREELACKDLLRELKVMKRDERIAAKSLCDRQRNEALQEHIVAQRDGLIKATHTTRVNQHENRTKKAQDRLSKLHESLLHSLHLKCVENSSRLENALSRQSNIVADKRSLQRNAELTHLGVII